LLHRTISIHGFALEQRCGIADESGMDAGIVIVHGDGIISA
jgi:hypothetical protein